MKFVEEQLLCALRETPPETDCSVSIAVLETIGHPNFEDQQRWLSEKRAPRNGKAWHMTGERWEYTAHPDESVRMPEFFALSPHMPTSSPKRAPTISQPPIIVVAPVVPLKRRQ